MRVLHAIHDFLPRHRAGSEIYAANLAKAQFRRGHHITVLCAEYDQTRRHGDVSWRIHEGLPVAEIINNWIGRSFEDTYRPGLMTERIEQILDAVQPDVVHVHNLFNLSFELPVLAKSRGIPTFATLHDYTLVCPSGGQRIHRAASHVCETIDTARCARCYVESPFYSQLSVGAIASAAPSGIVRRAGAFAARHLPSLTRRAVAAVKEAAMIPVTQAAVDRRLDAARALFHQFDLFVAPSRFLAEEFIRLGIPRECIEVSDNGQAVVGRADVSRPRTPLRVGFVGTITWHKGVHVLVEAMKSQPAGTSELTIVGSLSVAPEYVRELRQSAAGWPVTFAGEFDPADIVSVMSGIDVLVVPSLWPENAPLVIQETFQAGVPVVASRIGGMPEFVTDGVNGRTFVAGDATSLAKIIREFSEAPDRVRELAARAPVVKSIDDDAADWDGRYERVIARRAVLETAS